MLRGRRKSRTFDTKRAATQWVAHLVSAHTGEVATGSTLRDAILRYAEEVTERKRGVREELSKIDMIQRVCPELFDTKLEDLQREHFEHFGAARLRSGIKNATVNRDLVVLSHTLTMARRWRMMSNAHNPMEHVDKLPEGEPRERRITEKEIDALTAHFEYRPEWGVALTKKKQFAGWAFLFAIETAMRRGEILKTTWGDVHTDKRYLHLPAHKTKTNSSRNVPLSRKAIEMIEQLPRGEDYEPMLDLKPDTLAQAFKKAKRLLDIQDLHFHDTRHEAVTRMAQKIPNALDLARITGHKDLRMLLVYYDRDASELAEFL